jgi:hypothetical protein
MSRNGSPEKHDHTVHTGSPAERVLAYAQAGREVVQDFCPLASSLEWSLGQEYLRQRGNKAFLSDTPVLFIVNNDGTLSKNAADVFFASLRDAEERGVREDEIVDVRRPVCEGRGHSGCFRRKRPPSLSSGKPPCAVSPEELSVEATRGTQLVSQFR